MESLVGTFERANPRIYIDVMWGDNPKPLDVVEMGHAHVAIRGAKDPALAATRI